jgi:hypothetical protein
VLRETTNVFVSYSCNCCFRYSTIDDVLRHNNGRSGLGVGAVMKLRPKGACPYRAATFITNRSQ